MNKNEFLNYVRSHFNFEVYYLISNILSYVSDLPEEKRTPTLCRLLSNTIGLTSADIEKIEL
jgi:hypothetical protein